MKSSFERKILWKVSGRIKGNEVWRMLCNEDQQNCTKTASVIKLKWAGNIVKMSASRITKLILDRSLWERKDKARNNASKIFNTKNWRVEIIRMSELRNQKKEVTAQKREEKQ